MGTARELDPHRFFIEGYIYSRHMTKLGEGLRERFKSIRTMTTPFPAAAQQTYTSPRTAAAHANLIEEPAEHVNGSDDNELQIILSFDVEEHYRIEAATGLQIDSGLKDHYRTRLEVSTGWLLDQLAMRNITSTFFIVGKVAQHNPGLVRAIHRAGHEVGSHSWSHKRLHNLTCESFREDVRRSKDVLEQIIGEEVIGYRAPTFSIVQQTSWAIDVLAELGFHYDSSIFPVWHDRYGIPHAPRAPFMAQGEEHTLLEIPPATLRFLGSNLPVGGGGYFRLLPMFLTRLAFRQVRKIGHAPVAMLYFHPWEFDPQQARLPLTRLSSFRTYVGLLRSQVRFAQLLDRTEFVCAKKVAARLGQRSASLPIFPLVE